MHCELFNCARLQLQESIRFCQVFASSIIPRLLLHLSTVLCWFFRTAAPLLVYFLFFLKRQKGSARRSVVRMLGTVCLWTSYNSLIPFRSQSSRKCVCMVCCR
ncbi:hypothetical protein, unlikely [Trypanosoma brucei gambiense DAL972]|uniref:Uncharacterized protein n=1 Tax=Trypanosoma brucei gambiense (strain MHOM/CI/86/DAL972) TaxID=679716 RepID=C9ZQG4_TRYB9|nr:hypothetical protein, unlikely [Trypanosoma brucei gambiense DAL972]CBH11644.1 hypothetical protein, unlikely [Trypanosoma brucei gambiense DAL972]|eukprot:XP_011773929.1 hypothetical protein, unlikely [Trypanosoma brucei gambiense DAL972]